MDKKQSRIDNSLRNMTTNFVGYSLSTFLAYITRIFLVRYLSAEYLGINGLFSNILSMLSLAELGVGSAMGFALYKPIADNDEPRIASLMRFYKRAYQIIGCTICVVGLLMLPFIDLVIQEEPNISENLIILYLIFLFDTVVSYFFSYKGALLVASQRNYITASISYVVTVVQHILQIVVLVTLKSYIPYLLVKTVGVVVNNVLIAHIADKEYPFIREKDIAPLDKKEKKDFFINVKALTINKLCTILVNNTDNIVITYFNGLITTGIASNYTQLMSILTQLVAQIYNGMTASIGNLNAGADNERKHDFFKMLNLSGFWVYSWAAIGLTFVSTDIVRLCFGREYVLDISIPFIMAVNLYVSGINNSAYTFKNTMGLFRYGQYLLLVTAAINLVLDFILGRIYGLFGIYVATVVARLLTNAWYEPYVIYKHGFHKNYRIYVLTYIKYGILFSLAMIASGWLCSLCMFSPVVNLVLKFIICTAVPFFLYWLGFHRTKEFQYMHELLKKIVHRLVKFAKH